MWEQNQNTHIPVCNDIRLTLQLSQFYTYMYVYVVRILVLYNVCTSTTSKYEYYIGPENRSEDIPHRNQVGQIQRLAIKPCCAVRTPRTEDTLSPSQRLLLVPYLLQTSWVQLCLVYDLDSHLHEKGGKWLHVHMWYRIECQALYTTNAN